MRKSEKTTFQWPKVSKLLTTLPRHRPDFRTGLRFSFWAPEVTVLSEKKPLSLLFLTSKKALPEPEIKI